MRGNLGRLGYAGLALAGGLVFVAGALPGRTAAPRAHRPAARPGGRASLARLPLSFEPNRGQAGRGTRFLAHAEGATVALRRGGVTLELGDRRVHLAFAGAHASAPSAVSRAPGRVNYMIGRDRARWHIGVPTYRSVTYRHAWRGIDVAFHGTGRRLEYDFVLKPHADARRIALRVRGAYIDRSGALVAGRFRALPPVARQARRPVASRFVSRGRSTYGVELGAYDRGRGLVIDPVLTYSTYLGGSGEDGVAAIAVGRDGGAYVAGYTQSAGPAPDGFPTAPGPPYQATNRGNGDAFVTHLNAAGNALVYSTYFGGGGNDAAYGVAVDPSGDAFLSGVTVSSGAGSIPIENPYQGANAGGQDVFVAELDPAGTHLLYSTYFGGGSADSSYAIALDDQNRPHITGYTQSADFPHNDTQVQAQPGGSFDAYLAILSGGGSTLPLSTFIGGSKTDIGFGVAVDSAGDSYVAGETQSAQTDPHPFPLKTPYQSTLKGSFDAFVTKVTAGGDAAYSTYLGGGNDEVGRGVAVNASKNAFVTGFSRSTDFPFVNPVDSTGDAADDAFVTELAPSGTSLVGSTLLGGPGVDVGQSVATAPDGGVWVGGFTASSSFPTAAPLQASYGGGTHDAFAAHLSAGLRSLPFSTYLGGGGEDSGAAIATDGAGAAYLAGYTASQAPKPFPTAGPVQPSFAGGTQDAFVAKLGPSRPGGGGGGTGGSGQGGAGGGGANGGPGPRCVVRKLSETRRLRIAARVRCPVAARVRLTLAARLPHSKRALGLGTRRGTLHAGRVATLTFAVSRRNLKRLAAAGRVRVTATLVTTGAGGATRRTAKTFKLTIRA